MMKKLTALFAAATLAACSNAPQQASGGSTGGIDDMQAVNQYRAKIATPPAARLNPTAAADLSVNASDSRPKTTAKPQPVIVPQIGIGYGYHRHHGWW